MSNTTLDFIRTYNGTSPFMLSLRAQLARYGTLSDKQIAAAERTIKPTPSLSGLGAIVTMMTRAQTNLKAPKLHFNIGDDAYVMRLKTARSKYAGSVEIVSRKSYWNDKFNSEAPLWYGRISPDGIATLSSNAPSALPEVLEKFASNPREAVIEYGRKTGECSFCGRFLSTPESVSVGYGPICAANYGLEWGVVVEYSTI